MKNYKFPKISITNLSKNDAVFWYSCQFTILLLNYRSPLRSTSFTFIRWKTAKNWSRSNIPILITRTWSWSVRNIHITQNRVSPNSKILNWKRFRLKKPLLSLNSLSETLFQTKKPLIEPKIRTRNEQLKFYTFVWYCTKSNL